MLARLNNEIAITSNDNHIVPFLVFITENPYSLRKSKELLASCTRAMGIQINIDKQIHNRIDLLAPMT